MDRELSVLRSRHHDDLQEVACSIGTDDQPTVRVFARILDSKSIVNGVIDVLVREVVLARRVADLQHLW